MSGKIASAQLLSFRKARRPALVAGVPEGRERVFLISPGAYDFSNIAAK
jgi:hypothetical protein